MTAATGHKLNVTDRAFMWMESTRTPMHVGGLLTFRLPPAGPRRFVQKLVTRMRTTAVASPFNFRLAQPRHRWSPAYWTEAREIDLAHHVYHCTLPQPGGPRELDHLVSQLHSQPLNMSRPPWECHVIEGLRGRRFAIYLKAHHCALDGTSALKLIRDWLTPVASHMNGAGPWTQSSAGDVHAAVAARTRRGRMGWLWPTARRELAAVRELGRALPHMVRAQENPEGGLLAAFHTPRTLFNASVTPRRSVATHRFTLDRLHALGAATGTTINDLALTVCAGAMRHYLIAHRGLPQATLVASVPVGLPHGDGRPGNAVVGFVCPLATDQPDPRKRLASIHAVTQRTKDQLRSLSGSACMQFGVLGLSPLILGQLSGLAARLPPLFNFVVSNVSGPREKLYLRGAELEAIYPISVLFDGYALNITLVGYAGQLTIGFTACPDRVPDLQLFPEYVEDALAELEGAVSPR